MERLRLSLTQLENQFVESQRVLKPKLKHNLEKRTKIPSVY